VDSPPNAATMVSQSIEACSPLSGLGLFMGSQTTQEACVLVMARLWLNLLQSQNVAT